MRVCIRKGPALRAENGSWRRVDLPKTICGRMTRTAFVKGGSFAQVPIMAVAVIMVRGHEYAATGKALHLPRGGR